MTLQPPLLFLHVYPPFPAESQGADSWENLFQALASRGDNDSSFYNFKERGL